MQIQVLSIKKIKSKYYTLVLTDLNISITMPIKNCAPISVYAIESRSIAVKMNAYETDDVVTLKKVRSKT